MIHSDFNSKICSTDPIQRQEIDLEPAEKAPNVQKAALLQDPVGSDSQANSHSNIPETGANIRTRLRTTVRPNGEDSLRESEVKRRMGQRGRLQPIWPWNPSEGKRNTITNLGGNYY